MICKNKVHNNQLVSVICSESTCENKLKLACQQCIEEFHFNHHQKCLQIKDFLNYQKYSLKLKRLQIQNLENQVKDLINLINSSDDIGHLEQHFEYLLNQKDNLQLNFTKEQLSAIMSDVHSQLDNSNHNNNHQVLLNSFLNLKQKSLVISQIPDIDRQSAIKVGQQSFQQMYKQTDRQFFQNSKILSIANFEQESKAFQTNSVIKLSKELKLFSDGLKDFQAQKYSDALEKFNQVIKIQPDFERAWVHKILAEAELKNMKNALNSSLEAQKNCPESCDIPFVYGLILEELQLYADAIKQYELATKRNPKNCDCLSHLAQTYYSLGEFDKSLHYLHQVFEINKNHKLAKLINGQIAFQKENFQLAADCFKDIQDSNAIFNYAQCLKFLNNLNEAQIQVEKYCRLEPKQPKGQILLGEILYLKNDIHQASDIFEKVIRERPDLEDIIVQYVIIAIYIIQDKVSDRN